MFLRFAREIPVEGSFEKLGERGGDMNFALAIGRTGFDEEHGAIRPLGEARSEDASGAASADHDIVVHGLGNVISPKGTTFGCIMAQPDRVR